MHAIENIMQASMKEIKEMVDVTTIIGEAVVTPDGSTVIPVSKVGFGFLTGGGEYEESKQQKQREYDEKTEKPFAGGSGAGISITPVCFLVVNDEGIKLVNVCHKNTYEKIIDAVPQLIEEVTQAFKICSKEDEQQA